MKFAFGTFSNEFSRNLPYQAATAVAFGLPYDEALKAVTANPAQIWGVGDKIGSIEEGKWADLMVTGGDPLETKTQVKQLFIKGKQVDLSSKHTRLYEKYAARPLRFGASTVLRCALSPAFAASLPANPISEAPLITDKPDRQGLFFAGRGCSLFFHGVCSIHFVVWKGRFTMPSSFAVTGLG